MVNLPKNPNERIIMTNVEYVKEMFILQQKLNDKTSGIGWENGYTKNDSPSVNSLFINSLLHNLSSFLKVYLKIVAFFLSEMNNLWLWLSRSQLWKHLLKRAYYQSYNRNLNPRENH